ncbi:MAG: hypothetical protein QM762_25030 [Chryseolinea sp.]
MNSTNKIIIAIAAAAAAGAVIGVAFAADSGPKLQERVKGKKHGWLSNLSPIILKAVEKVALEAFDRFRPKSGSES